jgi:hypothetical protein
MGKWTREMVAEHNEEALLLPEEYDDAILGMAERINLGPVVAYDADKLIELLANEMEVSPEDLTDGRDEQNIKYEMAIEHFEYNIKGAWLGENTPVYITTDCD